ncbi:MAG TPA: outer membrane beta-barrel protein [Pseudolabrys sp.]|nr:outer membrane beta-barrel protein [Pseudolabrys sp.]
MTWRSDSALARLGLLALLTAGCAPPAAAADLLDDSWLRGSLGGGAVRWDGVVLGAQLGYSSMNSDFGNSTSSQVAFILRNSTLEAEQSPSSWTTLPHDLTSSQSYGVFLGYNFQTDDNLVFGADISYNRPQKLETAAADSISRTVTLSDGTVDGVTITASSSTKLIDYGTVRGRLGYAIGQFLPYAVFGGAAGRFDYTNTSTVTVVQTPPGGGAPSTFGPVTQTDSQSHKLGYGFLWGLGMDVAITPNLFLRGEWQYIAFNKVGDIRSTLNTAQVGLGIRF